MSGCSARKTYPFLCEKRYADGYSHEKIFFFLFRIILVYLDYQRGTCTVLHSVCAELRQRIAF